MRRKRILSNLFSMYVGSSHSFRLHVGSLTRLIGGLQAKLHSQSVNGVNGSLRGNQARIQALNLEQRLALLHHIRLSQLCELCINVSHESSFPT